MCPKSRQLKCVKSQKVDIINMLKAKKCTGDENEKKRTSERRFEKEVVR